ncbi:MAG: helix-turn-helix domain-containing protein, partial [Planctomycetota bacterium]
ALLVEKLFTHHAWDPPAPVRMDTIIDTACGRLAVSRTDLMGSSRHERVVLARALVAYLGREMTSHSYPEIARAMGRSFHSSAHSAAGRLRQQLDEGRTVRVDGFEQPLPLRELVRRLRHEILRSTSRA